MKNYLKFYLLLIVSIFIFTSCDEDIDLTDQQNLPQQDIELMTNRNPNKSSYPGYSFLKFKDIKIFNQTIAALRDEAENYDDNFIETYPELSGEELTDKEIEIGFNHYGSFNDFIKKYNFNNSMLNSYISEESQWLANEFLDITNDPGVKYLELEPEEMVVLNEDGVVQIADTIYIQAQNGYVTIPDDNIDGLFSYLDFFDFSGIGPINISWADLGYDFGNFSDWYDNIPTPTYNCSDDDTQTMWWNYSSTRQIKGVVKSNNYWMGGVYLKSKTVYYRRYWAFGYHWIQTRSADLTAALDGTFAGYECGDMYNHLYEDVNYIHRTDKYRAIYKIYGQDDDGFDIANDEMEGVHKKASFRGSHYLR